jgi:hypothetical protein
MMNKPLINPYTVGPPVMDENFYGRDILLRQVERSLRRTNVVLLQGQRRIGKTSVLRQLVHSLSQEQLETSNLVTQIPVFFDIQRYVQDTLPQFQFHLAGAITRKLEHLKNESLSIPILEELEKDPTLFQDKWLPPIHEQLENKELVILVDEFDNFDEQIAPHAMQCLVPFLGQLVSGENWLKWVFTLGRLSGKVSLEYDPIMRSGEEFRLTFLSYDEAYKLIVEPAKHILIYSSETIKYIYQLTNGQPHLIQAICSQIFEYLLDEDQKIVMVESVDAVISQTLKSYGSAISSIVSVPPIEEKVLIAIAQLSNSETSITRNQIRDVLIQNDVRLSIDDLQNAIESLLKWELLKGSSETLQITIKLVEYWLRQNKLIELSQQENLNIQYALSKSRSDFARQALVAGHYEWAIKDYREALEYIPNDMASLKGLAEAYRLNNDVINRIEILKKLHFYDRNNLNELIEGLSQYAEKCEQKKDFSNAIDQYNFLIRLQSNKDWYRKKLYALMNKFEEQIKNLEKKIILFQEKKDLVNTEIDNTDFFDQVRYPQSPILSNSSNNKINIVKSSSSELENRTGEQVKKNDLVYHDLANMEKDIDISVKVNNKNRVIQKREFIEHSEHLMKIKEKNKINELKKLASELNLVEQEINNILEENTQYLDIYCDQDFLNILKYKKSSLSKRVEIELAKFEKDLKKAASLLIELDRSGEQLDEKDTEIILLSVLSRFDWLENSFKLIIILFFVLIYIIFLSWLVKDWYMKAFASFVAGSLMIAGLIIPFIIWGLTEGIFFLLKRAVLKIMIRFKLKILNLVGSEL